MSTIFWNFFAWNLTNFKYIIPLWVHYTALYSSEVTCGNTQNNVYPSSFRPSSLWGKTLKIWMFPPKNLHEPALHALTRHGKRLLKAPAEAVTKLRFFHSDSSSFKQAWLSRSDLHRATQRRFKGQAQPASERAERVDVKSVTTRSKSIHIASALFQKDRITSSIRSFYYGHLSAMRLYNNYSVHSSSENRYAFLP